MTVAEARATLAALTAERKLLLSEAEDRLRRLSEAEVAESRAREAHAVLLGLAESCRGILRDRVERVVTIALQDVFGSAYRFRFVSETSRGASQLYSEVSRDAGKTFHRPSSLAGGVLDVVGFAIRVTLILWARPKLRRVLIADEPFRHVSDSHIPRVAEMVRSLSKQCGVQFLIVSHERELAAAADEVFTVERDSRGRSSLHRRST